MSSRSPARPASREPEPARAAPSRTQIRGKIVLGGFPEDVEVEVEVVAHEPVAPAGWGVVTSKVTGVGQALLVTNLTVSLTVRSVLDLTLSAPLRIEPARAVVRTVTTTLTVTTAPGASVGVV